MMFYQKVVGPFPKDLETKNDYQCGKLLQITDFGTKSYFLRLK